MHLRALLDELYAEQSWLEMLIAALAVVQRSPAHPLGERLLARLQSANRRGWMMRLSERKKLELFRLASRIVSTAGQRPPTSGAGPPRSKIVPFVAHRSAA